MTEAALEGQIDRREDDNSIYLTLDGHDFECRRVSVTWQMMRFAIATRDANAPIPHPKEFDDPKHLERCKSCADIAKRRNDAGMGMMATMHDTVMKLLKPHERDRFELFMRDAEVEPDELEHAIGDVIARIGSEGKDKGTSSHSSSSQDQTSKSSASTSYGAVIEGHADVT